MIEFENQILINRPVDEVFDFLSDFTNVPKWNYYVLSVEKTSDGDVGPGTRYHQIRKTDEQTFTVIEHEPGKRVTVKTLPGSKPAFEMRFTFLPEGEGTRLIDTWFLETGRPELIERLTAGRVKLAVMENLQKLKQLLETGVVRLQDGRLIER
jgi:uncharacterized membrane protein